MSTRLRKLERHATRAARSRSTPADMLTRRGAFAYARRRLSLPLVRAISGSLLHAAEWFVLSMLFDPFYLTPILIARVAFAITTNLGSGLVEPLRADLRALGDDGERSELRARLDVAWTRATIGAAMFVGAGLLLTFVSARAQAGVVTVVDLFVLAAVLRTAASWWTRTFEAGVQAFGRIPRHPAWFFGLDVIESLLPLVLWPWLGPWGVPLVVIVTTTISTALALHYAKRAYAMRGHERPRFVSIGTRALWRGFGGLTALRALAIAAAQEFPGAVVAAALASGVDGAVALYFARPVLALLQHVGRLHYADFALFRRLGSWGANVIVRHTRRVVVVATVVVALALGAVASLAPGVELLPILSVTFLSGAAGLGSIEITSALIAANAKALRTIATCGVVLTVLLASPPSPVVTAALGGLSLLVLLGVLAALRARAARGRIVSRGRMPALDFAAFVTSAPNVDMWRMEPTTRESAACVRMAVTLAARDDVAAVCALDRTLFVATTRGAATRERLALACAGLAFDIVPTDASAVRARMRYDIPANANVSAAAERPLLSGDVGTVGTLSSAIARSKSRPSLRELHSGDYDVFPRWSAYGDLVDVVFVPHTAPAEVRNGVRRAMWNESLAALTTYQDSRA
jgi:hypothetical protein